jgi:DNA-binding transcriptional ArsR family regulator
VSTEELGVAEESGVGRIVPGEPVDRLVALGRALSDICICEFEDQFGMGQSKISYHMRKLKDAGLVREERRGR